MNGKVVLLIIGLVLGAVVGYVTRPASAELTLGPVSVQVQGSEAASGNGPMTSVQWQHLALFTVLGGVIGLAAGFIVDRRRV